jgi:DNA end-binding protein Ku
MHADVESQDLRFELVDSRDFSPIGYRKVNKNTRREVPADKIVRTYPVEGGESVVVTDADFIRARAQELRGLDISGFLPLPEIPVACFATPYSLAPGGRDAHAYALLRETLRRTGLVALTRVLLRTREHLGVILPEGEFLLFNTLRYPSELRRREVPEALTRARPPADDELTMAERLVREMEADWNPEDYQDRYRDELLSYIRRKAEAGEARKIFEPEAEEAPHAEAPSENLTALLEQSFSGRPQTPKRERRHRRPAS